MKLPQSGSDSIIEPVTLASERLVVEVPTVAGGLLLALSVDAEAVELTLSKSVVLDVHETVLVPLDVTLDVLVELWVVAVLVTLGIRVDVSVALWMVAVLLALDVMLDVPVELRAAVLVALGVRLDVSVPLDVPVELPVVVVLVTLAVRLDVPVELPVVVMLVTLAVKLDVPAELPVVVMLLTLVVRLDVLVELRVVAVTDVADKVMLVEVVSVSVCIAVCVTVAVGPATVVVEVTATACRSGVQYPQLPRSQRLSTTKHQSATSPSGLQHDCRHCCPCQTQSVWQAHPLAVTLPAAACTGVVLLS